MNTAEHQLIEKILQLPPTRLAEVTDFVDFLRSREADHSLTQAAANTSTASFAAVWDNDDATTGRLALLKPHPGVINGKADELAQLSWEQDWKPSL